MTEAEWLAATDPKPILEFLRVKAADRKLRLFACACCRKVQALCRQEWADSGIELAERMADGGEREEWFNKLQYELGPGLDYASAAVASAILWWDMWDAVEDVSDNALRATYPTHNPTGTRLEA